jgi:hypothetical protein
MKYPIFLFIIFFFSCQQKKIESINVLYHNTLIDGIEVISCNEIIFTPPPNDTLGILDDGSFFVDYKGILDTTITDKKKLLAMAKELEFAKKTEDYGIDARMKCYIKFTNNSIDSICLANPPTYGYYNGQPMQFTNKFAYLIRENCGFYKWIGISEMPYFDELNDPTFERKKVVSRSGEMY